MSLKSSKLQYCLWLLLLTAFFIYDSLAPTAFADKQAIGSWSIRFLFEFTVILAMFAWFSREIKPWHLFPLSALVHLLIWREWIDDGFKGFANWLNNTFDLAITVYPQMGLMVLASMVLPVLLVLCLVKKTRTAFRIFSLALLLLFSSFMGLAHWQSFTNIDERIELILSGYKKLSIQNINQLKSVCESSKLVCFSGTYTKEGELYQEVYRPPGSKDVPEHDYFVPGDFGGFSGVNTFSEKNEIMAYTWATNYLEFSTIDSPLKFVSYNKYGDQVFILVDDESYLKTKQEAINLMKPFLFVFGVVWVMGGLGIFLMHQRRRKR